MSILRRAPELLCITLLFGCQPPDSSSPAISLVREFAQAEVSNSPEIEVEFPRLEWRFDGKGSIEPPKDAGEHGGWKGFHQVENLALRDGRLTGRGTGDIVVLTMSIPEGALPEDLLGALQLELKISQATELGVLASRRPEIDKKKLIKDLEESRRTDLIKQITGSDEMQTFKLTEADSPVSLPTSLGSLEHLGLIFFGAEGAEFEIESIAITTRSESLSKIPAGVGWQGLGGIFRETVVARTPEQISWQIELGLEPWLDLAIGSPDSHPATYLVQVEAEGFEPISLRRLVTHADRWHEIALDLDELAGETVRISLALEGEEEGRVAFWGTPTVRHRHARPDTAPSTEAREALGKQGPPKGVIVIVADTLRKDHLDAWGYDRSTAPTLSRLAAEGTRFADNISQGSWTKVAISSILTSLYPSTHGIYDVPHRIPASVTTLAESFRDAGYATFHTSSVIFSGRNSNLQQGVEVLHERMSIDGLDAHRSKTAREYVDRLIAWIDRHRDQPFFVFLHVFDPHSPFRPFDPFDRRWIGAEEIAQHEDNLEKVKQVVDVFHGLPTAEELTEAGVDPAAFVQAEHAWYDASIRSMDLEINRLLDHLEEWGLADDVLLAFVADHGEEFLEHGHHWHGQSIYGEMINVPMFLRWPGVVPAGAVTQRTTQSIDLMPTLLELAQLPVPAQAQGQSLVPLMAGRTSVAPRPVFSERKDPPSETDQTSPDAFAVIHDGWKLIWNVVRRDERPEHELFDHRDDPLNLKNLAVQNPERVAQLQHLIEGWRQQAEAARVSDEDLAVDLSPEEIDELRALGYL